MLFDVMSKKKENEDFSRYSWKERTMVEYTNINYCHIYQHRFITDIVLSPELATYILLFTES
jgi:hypothetical protein